MKKRRHCETVSAHWQRSFLSNGKRTEKNQMKINTMSTNSQTEKSRQQKPRPWLRSYKLPVLADLIIDIRLISKAYTIANAIYALIPQINSCLFFKNHRLLAQNRVKYFLRAGELSGNESPAIRFRTKGRNRIAGASPTVPALYIFY